MEAIHGDAHESEWFSVPGGLADHERKYRVQEGCVLDNGQGARASASQLAVEVSNDCFPI